MASGLHLIGQLPRLSLSPEDPIRIGMFTLGQGDLAQFGVGVYEGALLASLELASLRKRPIELLVEEESTDKNAISRAIASFVSKQAVAVIGPMTYSAALKTVPLLERENLCVLIPSVRNPDLTRASLEIVFRIDFDGGAQVDSQVDYVCEKLNVDRVGIVHSTATFWTSVAVLFHQKFTGTTALHLQFTPGLKSFRSLAKDIDRLKPKALFASADEPDLLSMLLDLQSRAVRMPIVTCAALRASSLGQFPSLEADEIHLTEAWSPTGTYEHFALRFSETFGHAPGQFSPKAYDAVVALVAALDVLAKDNGFQGIGDMALEIDRRAIPKAMRRIDIDSVTGRIRFNDRGDRRDQGNIVVAPARRFAAQRAVGKPVGTTSEGTRNPSRAASRRRLDVFYSYAEEDEELRDRLSVHLAELRFSGAIQEWHFRRVSAGTNWQKEIDQHLNSADVILLLVSPDYLNSNYCRYEMGRALERHGAQEAIAIPIILRPCNWDSTALRAFQALPRGALPVVKWPSRDDAFENVRAGIEDALHSIWDSQ